MKGLTQRQKEVLEFISGYIGRFGYPPTFQEIADAFQIASKHGVVRHLVALERKGYITRSDTLARSIRIIHPQYAPSSDTVQLPLVGRVAAGFPVLAEENIEDYLMLPRSLVKSEGRYFALRVHGDSMVNAGILDGDTVIRDEVTVKRLIVRNNQKSLKAENPNYPDINPQMEWSIQGKVIGLIRDNIH
jgi:repressor LexA